MEISFIQKMHFFFGTKTRCIRDALEYCRNKFLDFRGEVSCVLIEEPIGFTVWIEDKNLNLLSGSESMDIVNQIDLDDLVSKMRNIGGVQIEARRYRLKVYPKCFVGSEAVEWMQSNLKLTKNKQFG